MPHAWPFQLGKSGYNKMIVLVIYNCFIHWSKAGALFKQPVYSILTSALVLSYLSIYLLRQGANGLLLVLVWQSAPGLFVRQNILIFMVHILKENANRFSISRLMHSRICTVLYPLWKIFCGDCTAVLHKCWDHKGHIKILCQLKLNKSFFIDYSEVLDK